MDKSSVSPSGAAAKSKRFLVTGAGGFVGSHLATFLSSCGHWVRGVDIKPCEFMTPRTDEFLLLDLRVRDHCLEASDGIDGVFNLAANMGGIGFIETVHAEVMHDNVLINTHMLEASRLQGVQQFFFSSSACVYPTYKQEEPVVTSLKEEDVLPADCDNEYGWEKLFTERLCASYRADYGMDVRVGRFHNIYGPFGTWTGGREKAPAAICRKVAKAPDGGSIRIWGDGKQTRSFCYIDDCLEGVTRLMESDFMQPLNIGSDELVTIDRLADMVIAFSGKKLGKAYQSDKPQGVRGRNSDNRLIKQVLNWAPSITLQEGIAKTYPWIAEQVQHARE